MGKFLSKRYTVAEAAAKEAEAAIKEAKFAELELKELVIADLELKELVSKIAPEKAAKFAELLSDFASKSGIQVLSSDYFPNLELTTHSFPLSFYSQ